MYRFVFFVLIYRLRRYIFGVFAKPPCAVVGRGVPLWAPVGFRKPTLAPIVRRALCDCRKVCANFNFTGTVGADSISARGLVQNQNTIRNCKKIISQKINLSKLPLPPLPLLLPLRLLRLFAVLRALCALRLARLP